MVKKPKISVVVMPLYVDRLRAFVANPTAKTWSPVSRLVKAYPTRHHFSYLLRNMLPIVTCNFAMTYHCGSCPLSTNSTGWLGHRCLAHETLHQPNLASRILLAVRFLAAYDEFAGMTTFDSPQLAERLIADEQAVEDRKREDKRKRDEAERIRLAQNKCRDKAMSMIAMVRESLEDGKADVIEVMYDLISKEVNGESKA